MKKTSLLFLFIITVLFGQAQTLEVDGVLYSVDTLQAYQVGPGTDFVELRLRAPAKRMDVFFLKADLKNPHIDIRATLGRDSIYGGEQISKTAARKSKAGSWYIAGTNGDFYVTTLPYAGYPISGNMIDGEIARIPGDRNVFAIDENKFPDIGIMQYSGVIRFGENEWNINSVNHLRGTDELILYNQLNGKSTRTNVHGTEVLVELMDGESWGSNKAMRMKVLQKEQGKGSMLIPTGKSVLSGHGTAATALNNLNIGDEIEVKISLSMNGNNSSNFLQMTGGDNYKALLRDGVIEQQSVWAERHPRTCMGYSQNRDSIIFCVVDGRGVSIGATTKELAYLIKSAGAWTAFNMDGGGSSTMYLADQGKAVNRTSDGTERTVANGIFVVSNAPEDNQIAKIKPYRSSVMLPKFGEHVPQFYAFNQYDMLLEKELQGVTLTCPESLGIIIDGTKFVATGWEPGYITATYNEAVFALIYVDFLDVSGVQLRLDSVIIDNREPYELEVVATTPNGETSLSPTALSWNVSDNSICEIDDGRLIALKNGRTEITGYLDSYESRMKVAVQIPEAASIADDKMLLDNWSLSASSFLKAKLNTENLPTNWQHGAAVNFIGAAGRLPSIKLTHQTPLYGLPDTVKLIMNIGDLAFNNVLVALRPNIETRAEQFEVFGFEQNRDFAVSLALNEIFNTDDRATFPVWFDNINFYIDAGKMSIGKDYTIAIREIALCYKDYIVSKIISAEAAHFSLYPNPVRGGELFVQLHDWNSESVAVQILDVNGKVRYNNETPLRNGDKLTVPTQMLEPALYLLQLKSENKASSMKFIVK